MKKTYIKPEMGMETIELESMIAASVEKTLKIFDEEDAATTSRGMDSKDRDINDWGGLW